MKLKSDNDIEVARFESNEGNYVAVDKDGNVGIGTVTPNEHFEITGNFRLPATTESTGIIMSDGNRFMHNFGTNNFFAGVGAGNFTTTGEGRNTGVGESALQSNTTGRANTATGRRALQANTTGIFNTATRPRST